MWGNDPDLTLERYKQGDRPRQTWLNPQVHLAHVGYLDRLNGPVDNKISSCLSCHSTASYNAAQPLLTTNLVPPVGSNYPEPYPEEVQFYFRNIPAGKPFSVAGSPLDYSLQLAFGIFNYPGTLTSTVPPKSAAEKQEIRQFYRNYSPRAGGQRPSSPK